MKPKLIMMIGLPGSGKSTKAEELAKEYDAEIFASDKLREEMFGNVNHQADNGKLFTELHRRVKNCLREGKSALIDATNLQYKKRMAFLKELKNIPCEKIAYLMATPYEVCLKRNDNRERKVPHGVIERMYCSFDIPWFYEGWDDIQIEYGEYENYYGLAREWVERVADYDQHNSHHDLTLGEHCKQTLRNVDKICAENKTIMATALRYAAMLHDEGKVFTQTFKNSKGEITEEAHYYEHYRTGSYDSLFFDMPCNKLYVATLVHWHMTPYVWERNNDEKMHGKYKNLWGEELYNDVMKLHKADMEAH